MRAHYARGADFERRIRTRMEEQGYTVFRSAGSKSPVDLIAVKDRVHYYIQAKSGKTKISRKERLELVDLAEDCGAIPVLVTRGLKFEFLREAA